MRALGACGGGLIPSTETILDTRPAPVGPSIHHRGEMNVTQPCEG